MVFRFEYYENVISKHHLKGVDWRQAARKSFTDKLDNKLTICSVKQLDENTVEIIKRKDCKESFFYKYGLD